MGFQISYMTADRGLGKISGFTGFRKALVLDDFTEDVKVPQIHYVLNWN